MRRFMIHLLVATVAFIVGVTAANLIGGRFGHHGRHGHRFKRVYVERQTHSLGAADERGCPYSRPLSELPAPPPPAPSAPDTLPAPAGVGEKQEIRIIVTQPDGTQKVVAPQAGELKKY